MADETNTIHLKASVDTSELDIVTEKAKELNILLEKASTLVKELAGAEINLSVKVEKRGRGLSKYETCEIVDELMNRDGVETHVAGPCAKLTLNVDGPAVVLSVID